MTLIKHTIEVDDHGYLAGRGGLICRINLGDLEDIVLGSDYVAKEELIAYISRILYADMYSQAWVGLAGDDTCNEPYSRSHDIQVSPWHHWKPNVYRDSFAATKPIFSPDVLESFYSYQAYHQQGIDLRDMYELCIPKPDDTLEELTAKEYWYQNALRYKDISPPDLVLPHDMASNSILVGKTFYLYRTKTAIDRFSDQEYCRKLSKELNDLWTLFKAKLYSDSALLFPCVDSYTKLYRQECILPCFLCSDTFAWGCADAENIPASEFDWIIAYLEETNWSYDMIVAICSWLRSGQVPIDGSNTKEFKLFFERVCAERGKPWEIINASEEMP